MIRSNGTPRRCAVASTKASRVNGVGSFMAVEIASSGTPSRAVLMWSTLLMTVPQVPSRGAGT
ncbi:hypothetical protein P9209_16980 [Prescottella defluvii]|nr:hypothetical protein P9209_16980 [Prescottella defluvii]